MVFVTRLRLVIVDPSPLPDAYLMPPPGMKAGKVTDWQNNILFANSKYFAANNNDYFCSLHCSKKLKACILCTQYVQ
jgi:hypothetical protein